MTQSEEISELALALAKAQGEIEGAKKGEVNPAFAKGGKDGKYADLAAVWDAIREPFSKNELAVIQTTRITDGGNVVLITTLLHSSGQWRSGEYPIMPVQDTPQALGSAMTYGRRYTLMALAGIAPVDDDGNEASGVKVPDLGKSRGQTPANTAPMTPPPASPTTSDPASTSAKSPPASNDSSHTSQKTSLADPDDFVIPGGANVGKKLKQFATEELKEMLMKAQDAAANNPSPSDALLATIKGIEQALDKRLG